MRADGGHGGSGAAVVEEPGEDVGVAVREEDEAGVGVCVGVKSRFGGESGEDCGCFDRGHAIA